MNCRSNIHTNSCRVHVAYQGDVFKLCIISIHWFCAVPGMNYQTVPDIRRVEFNPHFSDEPLHPYPLNWSISNFRGVWYIYLFFLNYFKNSCMQTVQTLIRRVLRRLIWVYPVCLGTKNGTLGIYVFMQHNLAISYSLLEQTRTKLKFDFSA